ncbi:hypothetical protein Rt10032_c01g0013 [Rhodotorula toruloides]|uniref:Uncharacterized protein n=1 Tax=Rhodotorula toruloides TaxID=5286 RepID=A0A511K7K3_RHOTO|nr:hypothetical protein Rt10032_c01g0013 [Rhodotorula toruloides]
MPAPYNSDVTTFEWTDLLDGSANNISSGLLDERDSWLLDRSAFTIGTRTPAGDRIRRPEAAAADAGVVDETDEEDQVLVAQVPRLQLSFVESDAESGFSVSHAKPIPSSPGADADGATPVPVSDGKSSTRLSTRSTASCLETQAQPTPQPAYPADQSLAYFLTATPDAAPLAVPPSSGPHSVTAGKLVPDASCFVVVENPSQNGTAFAPAIPLNHPSLTDEPSASDARASILPPLGHQQTVPSRQPSSTIAAAHLSLTCPAHLSPTCPAHILAKNHPAHPRRSLATALLGPSNPLAQSKKRLGDQGVKQVDDDVKRKVREAKTERKRKAEERRKRAAAEATRRTTAREEEKKREQKREGDKRDENRTPASESEPLSRRDAPALETIVAPPTIAFDADMSLPAMGAALDFPGELGAAEGGLDTTHRSTSTPARPKKRHLPAEEPAALRPTTANIEVHEVKRARRMTIAMPPPQTVEPIKEEDEYENRLPSPAPEAGPRRASRIPLALPPNDLTTTTTATAMHTVPLCSSKGRAIRISLRPPILGEPRGEPASKAEDAARPCPRPHRRASRISFVLAPEHDANVEENAAASAEQPVSDGTLSEQRRRTASRTSVAPTSMAAVHLAPGGTNIGQHVAPELAAAPTISTSRRSSRVPAAVDFSASSTAEHSLSLGGSDLPALDGERAAARPRPLCLAVPEANAALRKSQQPAKTLGGVTLPASFSFAAPSMERDLELERRRGEKERRDRLAEEVLAEKKRRKDAPDPMRRVSRFLEGIAEASQNEEIGTASEAGGHVQREEERSDRPCHAMTPAAPRSVEHAPPVARIPPPAPAPTSPAPASALAHPARVPTAALRRCASRASLAAVIHAKNVDQTASRAFAERLSSWKAREASSLHKTAGGVASVLSVRPVPDKVAKREKENAHAAAASHSRRIVAAGGVAAVLEKQLKERLEWSERQKKREEEVRRKREQKREEEAARERTKLDQLRASLTARDKHPLDKSAPRRAARS